MKKLVPLSTVQRRKYTELVQAKQKADREADLYLGGIMDAITEMPQNTQVLTLLTEEGLVLEWPDAPKVEPKP